MQCDVCSSIDFNPEHNRRPRPTRPTSPLPKPETRHHASIEDLQCAAERGCQLCRLIAKQLDTYPEFRVRTRPPTFNGESPTPEQKQIFVRFDFNSPFAPKSQYPVQDMVVFSDGLGMELVLGLFVPSDSSLARRNAVMGRPIENRPDSEGCFNIIQGWIQECSESHQEFCPVSKPSPLPTRVIDVSLSSTPRLLITDKRPGSWLALSHCWGKTVRFVLETANLAQRQQGIPLEDMPKAFSDAVKVTRRLGYRYLWIDSLCILQDSYEDWALESSQMLDYYENASLTIALDDSSGDEQGFLDGVRTSDGDAAKVTFQEMPPSGIQTGPEADLQTIMIRAFSPSFSKAYHFLSTRAWTLQESILSPRTVHYRSDHLHWHCQKHRKYELYEGTTDRPGDHWPSAKHLFLQSPRNLVSRGAWYRIIEDYMQRNLTFADDKLPALAGLARKVGGQTQYTYKAGIWLEDVHAGLLWHCAKPGKRATSYIAPSWSWASMETLHSSAFTVSWAYNAPSTENAVGITAKLLDCQVALKGADVYGRVLSGTITLKDNFLPLSFWSQSPIILCSPRWPPGAISWTGQIACQFDEILPGQDWPSDVITSVDSGDKIVQDIYLLHIANWRANISYFEGADISFFVVLSPTGDGNFRRLGIANALLSKCETVEGWEVRKVTIV